MGKEATPFQKEDLLTVRPSWRSYFVFYAAVLIFGVGPLINPDAGLNRPVGLAVSLLLIVFILFRRKTTFYRLTPEEVLHEFAFWGHIRKKSLPLDEIADLNVRRGFVHLLLGIGHLQFRSRLSNRPDLWWFGINGPLAVKKQVERFLPK
jgi:hypothetical protein